MSRRPSFAEVKLNADPDRIEEIPKPEPDEPFRIAILGDFSGRGNRGLVDPRLSSRRAILIDRDNFDQAMTKLDIQLTLPLGPGDNPSITLRFHSLDEFHPDSIFDRVDLFKTLRRTRRELLDPATFDKAAATLQGESMPCEKPQPPQVQPRIGLNDLLSHAIEETGTRYPTQGRTGILGSDWDSFLHQIVAPHRVAGAPANQASLIAQVDGATGSQMSALLHHPDFQALEAAWRAIFFLASRLETGTELQLHLFDISKKELATNFASAEDLRRSEIYRLLVEKSVETEGAQRWAILAGNYTFDTTSQDLDLLNLMALVARHAGAPFLTSVSPRFIGCKSFEETPDPDAWTCYPKSEIIEGWRQFRRLPEANWLGVSLPRFLLRLPYGEKSDPVEKFDFEEMPETPVHGSHLWGNPAFACVCLLGEAFSRYGREFRPGVINEIANLPYHTHNQDGEVIPKPCAEILMTERIADRIMDSGIMPLASLQGSDTARLVRFQSAADPPAALAGRWFS